MKKRWMSKWERSKVYISIKSNTEILIFKRLKRDLKSRTEYKKFPFFEDGENYFSRFCMMHKSA